MERSVIGTDAISEKLVVCTDMAPEAWSEMK
jgi:hypothetical protein